MARVSRNEVAWRAVTTFLFLSFSFIGFASAGPSEDFAAGMTAYKRSDFSNAMPLLRRAADAGHVEAQVALAALLDATDFDEEAVSYYRKAAAAGSLDGIFGLGAMLAIGEGVPKDVAEARILITRAAEGGQRDAIAELAQAYIQGGLGIPDDQRNGSEALKWINLAADADVIVALHALEKAYRSGGYGLQVDVPKADQLQQRIMKLTGAGEQKSKRKGSRR